MKNRLILENSAMLLTGEYEPSLTAEKPIGGLLIEAGLLKPSDIEIIQRCQSEHNLRFGEAAVLLGMIKETDIIRVLSSQFD